MRSQPSPPGNGPIAIDAERASGFRYSQRAYLIQIFRRGCRAPSSSIRRPIGDFDELNDAIARRGMDPPRRQPGPRLPARGRPGPDAHLRHRAGRPTAGLPRVGLGTVVESLLGIHLAKEHSAADWSTRPLPQSWLVYAALDVELLVDLRDAVAELLDERRQDRDRRAGVRRGARRASRSRSRAEPWRRLSGVHSIAGARNLAVARELWLARDALRPARSTPPPGGWSPTASLVAAAKALPATKRDLAALKEFTGRASRTELDRWWDAIEAGRATDGPARRCAGPATRSRRRAPGRTATPRPTSGSSRHAPRSTDVRASWTSRSRTCSRPRLLRRLAWTPPEPVDARGGRRALAELGARPWQIDATAQTIADAFVEADQAPTRAARDRFVGTVNGFWRPKRRP